MHSDSLWKPLERVASADDDTTTSVPDYESCGDFLATIQPEPRLNTDRGAGLPSFEAFRKSPACLSPIPSKGPAYYRGVSLEHVYNDDSLHGVSSTTGFAPTTERTSPTTVHSSTSDLRASPAPISTLPSIGATARIPSPIRGSPLRLHHNLHDGTRRERRPSFPMSLGTGYAATQGTRRAMEDRHCIESRDDCTFLGVYDGHGGAQCAEYLQSHLHNLFFDSCDRGADVETALTASILEAEESFVTVQSDTWEREPSGSCCAAVVVTAEHIVVGNVGDSEVVRCRGGEAEVLSVRHTPRANEAEKSRIESAGGRVVGSRVKHPVRGAAVATIALSRSIGDAGFKLPQYTGGQESGVIGDPDVKKLARTDEDEFLVIACDGLWDAIPHATVVEQCRAMLGGAAGDGADEPVSATAIADALVNMALEMGTTDNVTVVVVILPRRNA